MSDKKCSRCGELKPYSDFPKNKAQRDGYEYRCKPCNTIAYRERRIKNPEVYKKKDTAYYEKNKAAIIESRNTYNSIKFVEVAARQKVGKAVKNGELIRPESCSTCNKKCKPDAHHHDYSKPLDVVWLCRSCHLRVHSPVKV